MRFVKSLSGVIGLCSVVSSSSFADTQVRCNQGITTLLTVVDSNSTGLRAVVGEVSFKIPGSGSTQILQKFIGVATTITKEFDASVPAYKYTLDMQAGSVAVWEGKQAEIGKIVITQVVRGLSEIKIEKLDGTAAWTADTCSLEGEPLAY